MGRPVVLGIERVANPHILPIFDELRLRADVDFTGCVLLPLPSWRVELAWPELPEDSPYLQPWRRGPDRARYLELTRDADFVIWPGIYFPRSLRLISGRTRRGQLSAIWAEGFIQKKRRPWPQRLALRAMIRLLNSPRVHLLALGSRAAPDHREYGATRWGMWQFGYAVAPVGAAPPVPRLAADGVPRILFVGALRHLKGVDVLLRALATPELRRRAWRLTLVGEGKRRTELVGLADTLGLSDRVRWAGAVPHDQIGAHFVAADVLVLPSRADGWGAVINEAMEFGLAVVASDACGAARMLIEPGTNGFIFPSEDEHALGDCLGRLVGDLALCGRMCVASRERIARFRPGEAARCVAALLRGLTGHGPMPNFPEGWCQRLT